MQTYAQQSFTHYTAQMMEGSGKQRVDKCQILGQHQFLENWVGNMMLLSTYS